MLKGRRQEMGEDGSGAAHRGRKAEVATGIARYSERHFLMP